MKIATTSLVLQIPERNHDYSWITHFYNLSESDFRVNIGKLSMAEYFVFDSYNRWIGSYVGFCLASNIPFIQVDLQPNTFHGTYANLSRNEWREFSDKLEGKYEELELSEEIQAHYDRILDEAGMAGVSVRSIFDKESGSELRS